MPPFVLLDLLGVRLRLLLLLLTSFDRLEVTADVDPEVLQAMVDSWER